MRKDFRSGEPSGLDAPRTNSTAGGAVRRSPENVFAGKVKVSCTPSPACWAERSVTATGIGGEGGVGSPGAPQPLPNRDTSVKTPKAKLVRRASSRSRKVAVREFRISIFKFRSLQDIAAQILILNDIGELLDYVGGIDLDILLLQIGRLEGKLVENLFKDGVKAPGADVFGLLVNAGGKARDGCNGIFGEVELDAFGLKKRNVLLDESIFRLRDRKSV